MYIGYWDVSEALYFSSGQSRGERWRWGGIRTQVYPSDRRINNLNYLILKQLWRIAKKLSSLSLKTKVDLDVCRRQCSNLYEYAEAIFVHAPGAQITMEIKTPQTQMTFRRHVLIEFTHSFAHLSCQQYVSSVTGGVGHGPKGIMGKKSKTVHLHLTFALFTSLVTP